MFHFSLLAFFFFIFDCQTWLVFPPFCEICLSRVNRVTLYNLPPVYFIDARKNEERRRQVTNERHMRHLRVYASLLMCLSRAREFSAKNIDLFYPELDGSAWTHRHWPSFETLIIIDSNNDNWYCHKARVHKLTEPRTHSAENNVPAS